VSEAGLSAAEVGKEIEHHLKHSNHPMSRHDRIVTIIEAALLATVALLAAWSGFAAAKWSTESRLQIAEASASRVEANRAFDEAAENNELDNLAFNSWFGAAMLQNEQAMEIAEARFRPEFDVAFQAWLETDPLTNPDAPAGPTAMPEYVQPELAEAAEHDQRAEELSAEGAHSAETADRYVRTTVFLATVLFLVGISGHFTLHAARYGLIGTAIVILVIAVALLVTSPWPPT
jgi:hypothetical protein